MDLNSTPNNEYLLHSVADGVSSLLAYWDKNQLCRFANSAYLAWFGERCHNMAGQLTMKEFLGDNYEKNLPFILLALNGEPQMFEREVKVVSGETRHVLANYYPDRVEGEIRGFFAQIIDITSLKVLEKELLASNRVIINQNERLLNFANIVSHNLKTYAFNLKEVLALYKEAVDPAEKELLFRYLEDISTDFSSTVGNLHEIAHAENSGHLPTQEVNLLTVITSRIDLLKIQVETSGVHVINEVPGSINLRTNLSYLESIILNLLTNGIKYRALDKQAIIRISAERFGDEILLRFEDNGIGIDLKKYRKKLFQIYQTFNGNKDAKGIGLYITKFQIEAMGGHIEVESAPGIGSVFNVRLPLLKNKKYI